MELVTVIIPCYNQEEYIEETVHSVLKQTYKNIEIIIVNDGSTDNSKNKINEIVKDFPSIRSITIENGGVSKARNEGIKRAHGKYILPLDADDIIAKDFIDRYIQVFIENPKLLLVSSNAFYFGEKESDWVLPKYTYKKLLHGNVIFASSIFKKEDWKKIGGYDENLKYREDWEFFIRLLQKKPTQFHRIEDYKGFGYRLKKGSKSTTLQQEKIRQEVYNYIYNKHKESYFKFYGDPISLIKNLEQKTWIITKLENKILFLKKIPFIKYILKLREKRHAQ